MMKLSRRLYCYAAVLRLLLPPLLVVMTMSVLPRPTEAFVTPPSSLSSSSPSSWPTRFTGSRSEDSNRTPPSKTLAPPSTARLPRLAVMPPLLPWEDAFVAVASAAEPDLLPEPLRSALFVPHVLLTEAATETEASSSWRQYVPLAASAFVIVDVALGSPFAKGVMSVVRSREQQQPQPPQSQQQPPTPDSSSSSSSPTRTLSDFLNAQNALLPLPDGKSGSERVDTRAVAQQALDKAAASLELRKFLDESKSEAEKLRDAQRKLDAQLRAYDEQQKKNQQDDDENNPPKATAAFLIVPQPHQVGASSYFSASSSRWSTSNRRSGTTTTTATAATTPGDPLRAATGIRPSLHPLTINALSSILQSRSTDGPTSKFRVDATTTNSNTSNNNSNNNLSVALAASAVAAQVIQTRQAQSDADNMTLTAAESQTVAGRIVGVVVRLPELEALLQEKCQATPWIAKYNEWETFGVLPTSSLENDPQQQQSGATDTKLDQRIAHDPLFALQRAECLLALFLHTVEKPQLKAKQAAVPDRSRIDFLDSDRREVLLGE